VPKLKKILMSIACVAMACSLTLADSLENVRKAPELSFSLPGKGQQLLSQYRGKVVALEFIFTTCPHCQAASKYMTKLQNDLGSKGLQVIDVAVNANADLLVENFAKDFQVGFPVGWTNSEQMQSFMGFASQRYVVPQLVLIDRKGNIHWQTPATTDDGNWEKIMNQDAIRQHVEELIGSGGASTVHTTKLSTPKRPS
jgi:thiol-disulfide isomerase/thioredoxin